MYQHYCKNSFDLLDFLQEFYFGSHQGSAGSILRTIEVKDDAGLDHDGSSGSSENYFGSGCILKVDPITFASQLGCGVEKKGQG